MMAKLKLEYEFNTQEDHEEIQSILKASSISLLLWDIDQNLRYKLKHCDEDWLADGCAVDYLESLREMISDSGLLMNA